MKNVVHVFTQKNPKGTFTPLRTAQLKMREQTGEVRVEVNGRGGVCVLLNWEDVTVEQGGVLECTRTDKTVHYNRECVA